MKRRHPAIDDWNPLSVEETVELFAGAPFRWWIAGGRALDLHLGQQWREHEDTDVGVVREEAALVYQHLDGWGLWVAAASLGDLVRWRGKPLDEQRNHNNVWAHREGDPVWSLDLTVGSGTGECWVYRRNPRIRRRWNETVLVTSLGVPYLAPDIQLLFKAKNPRPKDDLDAGVVIPSLTERQRRFLLGNLPTSHHWRPLLER